MNKISTETLVGLFVIIGFACFAFIAIKLGDVSFFEKNEYTLSARFTSASGLKVGAPVELAGVRVGLVKGILVDPKEYEAVVTFTVKEGVELPSDSIASIRTAGIIGDKYIKLTPGGMFDTLADGGEVFETESAISIEELVSKYIFEKN
ncbi:MAG: outer membrane lipid asymmetry maintenance protein MlaD [Deltaproteobacteria bacterium]|nr:MAG: outer membrane lipid asymmetry maintenance protein MlaD [Deltaproteobacteria bacterium]